MDFWGNFKNECKKQKVSIIKIAESCGLSYRTVSSSISRNNIPSVENAYLLASALGVSVEYLLTGKVSNINNSNELQTYIDTINQLKDKLAQIQTILDS